jgi:2-succinyl-5-enolpyruvyl-6-hydroxy-3-cyclohexene-1-carboxylate synthase
MENEVHIRQGIRDIPAICEQFGIEHAVITPGSRNAPLIMAFIKYSSIKCLSITDERSAAFFALGISQYLRKPVALVCTSGSALLNCAPAISEAYYQNIPLVVFTADRPKEWIDMSDGQTIRQQDIFRNYCKASFEIPVETRNNDELWHSNRIISQAIDTSILHPYGPVHVNVPLREPLYLKLPTKQSNFKIIQTQHNSFALNTQQVEYISAKWQTFQKKLFIFGVLPEGSAFNVLVNNLSAMPDTVVFAENLSNISSPNAIWAPEALFASVSEAELENFRPDLLVTIGHSIVSKRVKQFLRKYRPSEHWHIEESNQYIDTFKSLTKVFIASPLLFLKEIEKLNSVDSDFAKLYTAQFKETVDLHEDFLLNQSAFADLFIFGELLKRIPANSIIHLANSTPIRYSQLFCTRHDLTHYSNRGTSGIDGCISTAVGSAYTSGKLTVVITGDLSFLYDSNALWNNYLQGNLKIIVLNNKGGNIFRLIDTSEEISDIMDFFETPQQVNIKKLVEAYGIEYRYAENADELRNQLNTFFTLPVPAVFEIKTNPDVNTKVFINYYKHIKQVAIV